MTSIYSSTTLRVPNFIISFSFIIHSVVHIWHNNNCPSIILYMCTKWPCLISQAHYFGFAFPSAGLMHLTRSMPNLLRIILLCRNGKTSSHARANGDGINWQPARQFRSPIKHNPYNLDFNRKHQQWPHVMETFSALRSSRTESTGAN